MHPSAMLARTASVAAPLARTGGGYRWTWRFI
jgi:hypothetical protein